MRRSLLLGFGVVVVFVLLVAAVLRPREATVELTAMATLPSGIPALGVYNARALVFSNGRAFVTYDTSTGKTTLLSPDKVPAELQFIDSLSASPNHRYLLFHSNSVVAGGTLAGALQSKGLDPQSDYWWVYDIPSETYTPLTGSLLFAQWTDSSDIAGLALSSTNESIDTYQAASGDLLKTMAVPRLVSFAASDGMWFLSRADGTLLATRDGVVNRIVGSSMQLLEGQTTSGIIFAVTNSNNSRQLVKIDATSLHRTVIASGITDSPALSPDHEVVFKTAGSGGNFSMHSYDYVTGKEQLLDGLSATTAAGTRPLGFINSSTLVTQTTNGRYQLVGQGLPQVIEPDGRINFSTTVDGHNVIIGFDQSTKQVTVYTAQPPSASDQAAAEQRLRQFSVNPDLVNISFVQNTGE